MERALSRDAVQEALGVHTPSVLPTVDELTELIANVEVQAFMRNFAVGDDLLRAAWYLHGVASATQAPELYTLPRQRRAFAVSAHIFDLALNDTSRGRHDRLTLTFAAQVGYRRAELDPNATAVYRRVVDLLRDDLDVTEHIDTLALQAGVAFLGLDPGRLGRLQRQWRRQLTDLAASVGMDDLRTTMFGPAERVVLAISALLAYLPGGDGDQLELARSALVSVVDLAAGEGDQRQRPRRTCTGPAGRPRPGARAAPASGVLVLTSVPLPGCVVMGTGFSGGRELTTVIVISAAPTVKGGPRFCCGQPSSTMLTCCVRCTRPRHPVRVVPTNGERHAA